MKPARQALYGSVHNADISTGRLSSIVYFTNECPDAYGYIVQDYRRHLWKRTLTVSFQFHHTQMDGAHAAKFLDRLQQEISSMEIALTK